MVEASRGGVNARRGTDNPERGKSLSVGDQERNGWEAGFQREYPGGRGGETVRGPSLDLVPKGVQAIRRAHAWCEQVRAIE